MTAYYEFFDVVIHCADPYIIMIIFGRKYYIFDAFRSLLPKGQLAVSSSGRLGDWPVTLNKLEPILYTHIWPYIHRAILFYLLLPSRARCYTLQGHLRAFTSGRQIGLVGSWFGWCNVTQANIGTAQHHCMSSPVASSLVRQCRRGV